MRDKRVQRRAVDSHEPVQVRHLEVVAEHSGHDFEKMLRRFTKKVRLDGVIKLSIDKSRFVGKSELRRKKSLAARRRERSDGF